MLILCRMEVDEELAVVIREVIDEYNLREPEDKAFLIEDIEEVLFDD